MTSNNGIAIFEDFPTNWELTTLGEVCKRGGGYVQTGPFGSQLHASDYVQEGIPTIMPVNLSDNQILTDGIARISEKDAERLSRHRLEPGDIVFSRRGDVTRRALIREEQKGWLCGTGSLKIHFGKDVVDPLFASLYFGHPDVKDWIIRHAVGSTMPNLNGKIMEAIPFLLPPKKEQEKIARILGALENKIELNRRMNHTLEEIARGLFKSWFVDFDPVTAKAEGRVPFGMNAETASLFPAEFEETQDEPIPSGWKVGSILEFASLLSGGTPSTHKSEYWNGDIAWVSAKDVSAANGLFLFSTERTISDIGLENSSAKLLPVKTTIVTARGTVGKYCILGHEMSMNQTNYGLRAKDEVSHYFTYFSLVFLVEQLQQNSYGTIFDTITTRTFQDSRTIFPSTQVIEAFEKRVTPMMNMILDNTLQLQTLTSIRGALLPKLLSGELRVKQAEKVIENM